MAATGPGGPVVDDRRNGAPPRETRHVAGATTQVKILVPGQPVDGGPPRPARRLPEAHRSRPSTADILVRGNEITISGPEDEAEQVARIFEELLALLEKGHELTDSSVGQTIELVKGDDDAAGRDARRCGRARCSGDTLLTARGKGIAPKTVGQKRFVDAIRALHRDVRDRPGRHRQDLPRRGDRGAGAAGAPGLAADPHPAGRRGGGAARVPARDPLREDRSVHAAALRRAVRDDRRRDACRG